MSTISVVIPCYNQGEYLSETLDSVLSQTFQDWECIIVNDGSSDNTESVAKSYAEKDKRFIYLTQPNSGQGAARNNGIAAAHSEFILPLDSDDLLAPDYMKLALEQFRTFPETKLCYGRADFIGNAKGEWVLPEYSYDTLLKGNCIFCSCIFRKKDFEVTGGYCTERGFFLEDYDMLLSLLKPGDKVYRIPEIIFHYRIHDKTTTSRLHNDLDNQYMKLQERHRDIYDKFNVPSMLATIQALSKELDYFTKRNIFSVINHRRKLRRKSK